MTLISSWLLRARVHANYRHSRPYASQVCLPAKLNAPKKALPTPIPFQDVYVSAKHSARAEKKWTSRSVGKHTWGEGGVFCILHFRLSWCECRRWTGLGVNRLYQSRTTAGPGPPTQDRPCLLPAGFLGRGPNGDRAGLLVWNGTLVLGVWRRSLEASSSSWAPTGARWCSWGSWRRWKAPPGRSPSRPVRGQFGVRPEGCAGLDPLSRIQTLRGVTGERERKKKSKVAPLRKKKVQSQSLLFIPFTPSRKSQSDDGFPSHSRVEQPSKVAFPTKTQVLAVESGR